MSTEQVRQERNAALLAAEAERAEATAAANLEYSRTVARLRAQFEADLAAANARRLAAVRPHHRAYNVAVVAAEQLAARAAAEEQVVAAAEYALLSAAFAPVPS